MTKTLSVVYPLHKDRAARKAEKGRPEEERIGCMGKNQHVVRHGKEWAVKGAGNERATAVFGTQAEAIEAGKQIAGNQRSELLVHGRNGQIRSKDSFGNDPVPPRDKEH